MRDDMTHEQVRRYVLWEVRQLTQKGMWVAVDFETSDLLVGSV